MALRFSPRDNTAHLIAWLEWGDGAFAEARSLERPILLSISVVWCHCLHLKI